MSFEETTRGLRHLRRDADAFREIGRRLPRRLSRNREDNLHGGLAGAATPDLAKADNIGAGLGHPVATRDTEIKYALLDVCRDLLRAQEPNTVDPGILDARVVAPVPATDDGEVSAVEQVEYLVLQRTL